MNATEKTLTALLDREAIRDLPLRYCDCVWRDDIDGLVDLFTPEGQFVVRLGERETVARGYDELRAVYLEGLAIKPRPYIHNHVVELTDERHARGRCYLDLRSEELDMAWVGAGYYDDDYEKVNAGWKFAARVFHILRFTEGRATEAMEKLRGANQ